MCVCMARDFSNMWDDSRERWWWVRSPTHSMISLSLSLSFSLLSILSRSLSLSIVLSCIHRCPVYLFFEPDTRVRELYIWTIWGKKKKKTNKKKLFHRCRSLHVYHCPMSGKMIVLVNVQYWEFELIGIKF
jgi:hypothetical protein